MSGSFDLSGLDSFIEKLESLEKQVPEFMEKAARAAGEEFIKKAVEVTPVGIDNVYETAVGRGANKQLITVSTEGGTLRAGWTADSEEEAAANKKGGGKSPAEAVAGRTVSVKGREYSIAANNVVHYASWVDEGHRQQVGRFVPAIGKKLVNETVKGRFFNRRAIAESEELIKTRLEKEQAAFLRGLE